MPEIHGTLFLDGKNLAGNFQLNPIKTFVFDGSIGTAIIKESIHTPAVLIYENENQLRGVHKFQAVFGHTQVTVTIDDGVKFSGKINKPFGPIITAHGEGRWATYHPAAQTTLTVQESDN
ncbi:hypothetical protein SISNIDRAFT_484515 [Sistotremastrum niveocremeum HHB9708]|uniref:Uncharacterized protein n=2 Tax=Sistotremastraceae TaxID=3402574 RepID=A0A164WF79_9AGAM|nr:hypothetical protein SISNIDRAFT_484515 [Sistotremastrum niveocremeum HHB9708]KZT34278.1 hypothetical protein SISSUDRAFT_1036416 [Sistotremastrum suecicum HHB10207 ss-3]